LDISANVRFAQGEHSYEERLLKLKIQRYNHSASDIGFMSRDITSSTKGSHRYTPKGCPISTPNAANNTLPNMPLLQHSALYHLSSPFTPCSFFGPIPSCPLVFSLSSPNPRFLNSSFAIKFLFDRISPPSHPVQ